MLRAITVDVHRDTLEDQLLRIHRVHLFKNRQPARSQSSMKYSGMPYGTWHKDRLFEGKLFNSALDNVTLESDNSSLLNRQVIVNQTPNRVDPSHRGLTISIAPQNVNSPSP